MNMLLFYLLFILIPTLKHNPELITQRVIQIHITETLHTIDKLSYTINEDDPDFKDDLDNLEYIYTNEYDEYQ